MRRHLMTAFAIFGLSAGIAIAESHEAECAMSYEVFETSVPHTDMEECPASMGLGEDSFCRVAVVAEVATVFVFSYDTSCLTKTKSFYEDEFSMVIK